MDSTAASCAVREEIRSVNRAARQHGAMLALASVVLFAVGLTLFVLATSFGTSRYPAGTAVFGNMVLATAIFLVAEVIALFVAWRQVRPFARRELHDPFASKHCDDLDAPEETDPGSLLLTVFTAGPKQLLEAIIAFREVIRASDATIDRAGELLAQASSATGLPVSSIPRDARSLAAWRVLQRIKFVRMEGMGLSLSVMPTQAALTSMEHWRT